MSGASVVAPVVVAAGAVMRMAASAVVPTASSMLVAGALAAPIAAADRVELRNGDVIEGSVATANAGALTVRRAVEPKPGAGGDGSLEALVRFTWDQVARVDRDAGEQSSLELAPYLELGERLWRARARLSRGDAPLAEEALAPYEPIDGPTGAVAALVELQVALARSDRPRAWRAWLDAARLRRRGFVEPSLETSLEPTASGTLLRRPLFDAQFMLCPSLPPFADGALEEAAILAVLDGFDAQGDDELDALRRMIAAVFDPSRAGPMASDGRQGAPARGRGMRGGSEESATPEGGRAAGNEELQRRDEFLRSLRDARSADPAERAKAREAISVQRRRLPEWAEAWSRFAAGSGLLLDAAPDAKLAGQLELLHVPARFSQAQPWLAARAAALAAEASRASGMAEEAARLELIEQAAAPPGAREPTEPREVRSPSASPAPTEPPATPESPEATPPLDTP